MNDLVKKTIERDFQQRFGRSPSPDEWKQIESSGAGNLLSNGGYSDAAKWIGDVFTPEKAKVSPVPFSAPAGTPGGKTSAESMAAYERNPAHYTPGAEMSPAMAQHLASGQARGSEGQAQLGAYGQQAATYGVGAANAGQNAFGLGLGAQGQMGQTGRAAQNYALNSGAGMVGQGQNAFSAIAPGTGMASNAGAAMLGAGNQLAGLEATQGPSAAQAQLNLATDQAMAQQLALARSGRGPGQNTQALAQAQRANAAIGTQAGNQAALLRAQEDAAWRQRQAANLGAAGGLYGNAGQLGLAQGQLGLGANAQALGGMQAGAATGLQGFGQNLGAQQAGTSAAMQGAQQNMQGQLAGMQGAQTAGQLAGAGYGIGFTGDQQGMQAIGADLAAKQAYEQMLTQQKGIEAGVAIQNAASANQFTGAMVGAGATTLGAVAPYMSDARAKENITPTSEYSLSLEPNRADMMADYQASGSQAYAGPSRDVMYDHMRRGALTEQRSAMDEQSRRDMYGRVASGFQDFAGVLQQARPAQPYFFEDVTGLGRSPYVTSDRVAKTDLRPARGYTYNYIDPARHGAGPQLGVMAQDLERTPAGRYAVDTGPDGLKRVDTGKLTMVNTAALSDEQRRNDALESRLRQLEDMLFGGADLRTAENTHAPKGSSGSPKGGPSMSDAPSNAHAAPVQRGPLAFETFDAVQAPPRPELDMIEQRRLRERTPLPPNSLARAAAGSFVDALVSPVRYVGETARRYGYNNGQANAASKLDGYQAVADVESLIRDETTTESRERQELGRQAHPNMTAAGDVLGGVAAGAVTSGAQRVAPRVRTALDPTYRPPGMSDAAFAARRRRMQRGGVEIPAPVRGKYGDLTTDELHKLRERYAELDDYKAFQGVEAEIKRRASQPKAAPQADVPVPIPGLPPVRTSGPLPAFDRRTVRAGDGKLGDPQPTVPAARSAPAARALERNAERAYGRHRDRPAIMADRARAEQFWRENPDYAEQAGAAAEFLSKHPYAQEVRLATESNSGMNTELRTAGERAKRMLAIPPEAPRKSTATGKVRGGTRPAISADIRARAQRTTRILEDAAKAGHAYKGVAHRGVNLPPEVLDEWIRAGFIDQKAMWSASANPKIMDSYKRQFETAPPVELRLRGKSGVPIEGISEFPHEHEIAFPPGRKWKITGVSKSADGHTVIDAEELDAIPQGIDAPHSAIARASDRRVA